MTQLIACLSTGKGTWGHVGRLINDGEWDKVFLITNEYGKENFNASEKTELLTVNTSQGLRELKNEIKEKLKNKISGSEIGLNIISGTGKEHMALVSALLDLGVGIRLIALTQDGIQTI